MAHADYNCCAVCDDKMEYNAYDARTKERICEACLTRLQKEGLPIVNVDQLVDWIEKTDKDQVRQVLQKLVYRFCYYANDVDHAVDRKGLEMLNDPSDNYIRDRTVK